MLCEDVKLIDEVDKKILAILSRNARANLTQIGRSCNLSSSAVLSRIKKLKKEKVIVGTTLLLKRGTLGFPYQASVGITAGAHEIESVVQSIRKQPNVIVCTKSIGRYNAMCLILARSTDDLDRVTQEIKSIPGVRGIGINLWTDEPYYRHYEDGQRPEGNNEKTDDIDRAIIAELLNDARTPFSRVASKLGVSHETVRQKYTRMTKNGTIMGCSVVIDYSKLEYEGNLFIFVSLGSGNNRSQIMSELKKVQELSIVTRLMGAFDMLALALAKSLKDTAKLVDTIQKIPGVERVEFCYSPFSYFSFVPAPRKPFKVDTLELA